MRWRSALLMLSVLTLDTSEAENCRDTAEGLQYTGHTNVTASGRVCQRWDANSPHRPTATCVGNLPDDTAAEAENFCRNQDASGCEPAMMPWCYTTDSAVRWEYCYIPPCGYTEPVCSKALGMESGDIADDQITASSSRTDLSVAFRARFNNNLAGWSGAWVATHSDMTQYQPCLQIDLLSKHTITKLYVQGAGNALNAYTTAFLVYTSTDGLSWQALTEDGTTEPRRLAGSKGRYNTIPHVFDPPLEASKIAVLPVEWYSYAALRLEVFGCPMEGLPSYTTAVTEDIDADTFWDLNRSPYVIDKEIVVRYSAKLTIQAGVKVFFTKLAAKLTIEGCLEATGLDGLEVEFLSSHVLANQNVYQNQGYWTGIEFKENACGKLEHVVVAAASEGITMATTGITLDNLHVRLCRRGLVSNFAGDLIVTNSVFENNEESMGGELSNGKLHVTKSRFFATGASKSLYTSSGMKFTSLKHVEMKVDGCQLSGLTPPYHSDYCIYIPDHLNSTFLFRDTTFMSAVRGIHLFSYNRYEKVIRVDVNIDYCVFDGATSYGFYGQSYTPDSKTITGHVDISNTVFQNGGAAVYLSGYSNGNLRVPITFRNVTSSDNKHQAFVLERIKSPITIEKCTFVRNRLHVLKMSYITNSPIKITDNAFLENGRDGIVSVERTTITGEFTPVTEITNNVFENNTVAAIGAVMYYKDVDHQSSLECHENIFRNPEATYDLMVGSAWKSGYQLDASNNDWGSADPDIIASRVYDFYTNMDRAEADLNPAVYDEDEITVDEYFSHRDGVIGGKVVADYVDDGDVDYVVARTIYIPAGLKVVLKGANTLTFKPTRGILVEGTLQVKGEGGNITFKASDAEWQGFRFVQSQDSFIGQSIIQTASVGIQIDSTSLRLNYVSIEETKYEGVHALLDHNQTLQMDDCSFSKSTQRAVVYVRSANPVDKDSHCTVSMRGGSIRDVNYGVDVQVNGLDFFLENMETRSIRYDDVKLQAIRGTIDISRLDCQRSYYYYSCIQLNLNSINRREINVYDVRIHESKLDTSGGNVGRGLYILSRYMWHTSTISVQHNTFDNDVARALEINLNQYATKSPTVVVSENTFHGGSEYAAHIQVYQPDHVVLKGNTFDGGARGLYLYIRSNGVNDGLKIEDNVFKNFDSSENLIHMLTYQLTATALIHWNTFVNNSVSSVIYIEQSSSVSVLDNVFDNHGSTFDLKTYTAQKQGDTMFARRNWWGSASFSDIGPRIYDQSDDPTFVAVDFEPYRTTPDGSSLSSTERAFFRADGEIGGSITKDTVLRKEDSPYTAVENILVPTGLSLTIEAGTTVYFQDGGITAQGLLLSDGSPDEPVVFLPREEGTKWKGISIEQPFSDFVRLVEGKSDSEGFVELFHDDQWHSVCDEGYSYYDKDILADIVCKQLGFLSGAQEVTSTFRDPEDNNPDGTDHEELSGDSGPMFAKLDTGATAKPNILASSSLNCYEGLSILQQCYINECPSGRVNYLVGVRCIPNTSGGDLEGFTFITSKATPGAQFSFNDDYQGVIGHVEDMGLVFQLVSPGLSGGVSTVSFHSFFKPGWYLRHYETLIDLEPKTNPRNANFFDVDATFTVSESDDSGFVTFESSSISGHYIVADEDGRLLIEEGDLSDEDFLDKASFSIDSFAGRRRRKRAADTPVEDFSSSVIRHTEVHSTVFGLSIKGSPPVLDGVLVQDTTNDGISYTGFAPGGTLQIRNCEIRDNRKAGIKIALETNSDRFTVEVHNTTLAGNSEYGVHYSGPGEVAIYSSLFDGNKRGIHFQFSASHALVMDSVMTGHSVSILERRGQGSLDFINNTVRDNIFTGGSIHALLLNYNDVKDKVINNSFVGNQLPYNYQGCIIYFESQQREAWVSGNTFQDNTVSKCLIGMYGASNGVGHIITNNVIVSNHYNGRYYGMASIWVTNSYNMKVTVRDNILNNPDADFELQLPQYTDTQSVVDASRNFWNYSKHWDVFDRIDCFYNNMGLAVVNIWPYRLTGNMDEPVFEDVDSDDAFFTGGIGGDVYDEITISAADGPNTVDRSILVWENATLDIAAGTILHFKPKRGIRVLGKLKISGTEQDPIIMSRLPDTEVPWYGISMDLQDADRRDSNVLEYFKMEYLTNGLVLRQYSYNITGASLQDAGSGMVYHGQGPLIVTDSSFINGQQGVYVKSRYADIVFEGCTFKSNNQGLTMTTDNAIQIIGCHFEGQTNHGLRLSFSQSSDIVRISGSSFRWIRQSISLNLGYGATLEVWITGNNFTEATSGNAYGALTVTSRNSGKIYIEDNEFASLTAVPVTFSPQTQTTGHCYIRRNTFREIKNVVPILLNYAGYVQYTVESNRFVGNQNTRSSQVTAIQFAYIVNNGQDVRIALNDFESNHGASVISIGEEWGSYNTPPTFTIEANSFLQNEVTTAVITTIKHSCEIHYNIFSNAQSRHDVSVTYTGANTVNATQNWWGTVDSEEISDRIYDQADSSNLGVVLFEPFLKEPEFSCEGVSNCSGHGACIRPDLCQCEEGWKGAECSEYSCSRVLECSGRGQCVAPNTCECDSGWLQPDCVRASCSDLSDCNNHGICVGPNTCRCATQFRGDACDECKSGYWGELCRPCPRCVNGQCHLETGMCTCSGANWAGELCDRCSEKYYGPECLPLIKVLRVAPNRGPDVGGNTVFVKGHNFPNSDQYKCRFGAIEVEGTWNSDEEIRCIAPAQPANVVEVEISTTEDGEFTTEKIQYTYHAVCPESACGSTRTPPRGICSMGTCQCINPWTGEDCDVLGVAPTIASIPPQTAVEGSEYTLELQASEGTLPIEFTLVSGPSGMDLDFLTGMVIWSEARASATPHQLVIRAKNPFGSSQMTVALVVPVSYTATLDPLPTGPFLQASQVLISGTVQFLEGGSPLEGTNVPVNIIIHSAVGPRTIRTTTKSGSMIFYERFYPSSRETGYFEVDARHPEDPGFQAKMKWSVYGLSFTTADSSLTGYLGEHSYSDAIIIQNTGVDALTNVRLSKVQLPFQLLFGDLNVTDSRCNPQLEFCLVASILLPGDSVRMAAFVEVDLPLRGSMTLRAQTDEGLIRQRSFSFDYKEKKPKLVLNPSHLSPTLIRGRLYTIQVNVTNRGLRPATNVRVQLPDLPMLSVISLGMASSDTEENLVLQPEDTAELSLGINPIPTEKLGSITGNIVVRSLETAESLTYRLTVVSSDKLDLVVRIEDEFTYFADDKPLLEGATVQLRSQFGGGSYTLTTDETGMVTFKDIREDYYSLYSSAPKHIGDSRVIFATASDSEISVFLERTAVTYSWVVTPVTFEDEYIITLEADFETFVPMPVVTIKPQELDLEVLQRGLMPVIDFELTNHGLIAANNVYFRLPARDAHPFMYFEMDIEDIGDLPANSTFYIPVRVIILEDEKNAYMAQYGHTLTKRNPVACLLLAIAAGFSYLCDRERFQEIGIPLKNGIEKNCGSGGPGGGGYGPSTWIGYSDGGDRGPDSYKGTISVTKPLTCDDLINCLLTGWYCFNAIRKGTQCAFLPFDASVTTELGKVKLVWTCWSFVKNIVKCRKYTKKCSSGSSSSSSRRKRRQAILSQNDLAPELAERLIAATDYYEQAELIIGDELFLETDSADWSQLALAPALADNSEGGELITAGEYAKIWDYPLPVNVTRDMVDRFVKRLNDTTNSWNNGILEGEGIISYSALNEIEQRISANEKIAAEGGYTSLADWYEDGYQTFEKAKEISEEGVCAKVRIRITQRLVLTRSAFSARLELENGEESELTFIKVEVIITNTVTKELATHLFSIGQPDMEGITDVDGTGSLGIKQEGSAQWLIVPYGTAAPEEDTQYDIGGTLFYTVGEDSITVPLFPDTVTVRPDPRLYLNYFLEKFVESDDALTEDIVEPTVPFSLGILVTNDGFGTATNLHITSGQPEIIENEKGLLIQFAIIGAQLGTEAISPSLRINFGDIAPHTTEMARWIMTSSLKGIFSNYSATFENTNPLGDPELSVMESVLFHELLHVVMADAPEESDDGIPDFLTIDESKLGISPGEIYLSNDGTNPVDVSFGNITRLEIISSAHIQIVSEPVDLGWNYFRSEFDTDVTLSAIGARRSDGRAINIEYNLWINTIDDVTFLNFVDYFESLDSQYSYDVTFLRANDYKPEFQNQDYYVNITEAATLNSAVITLEASDEDEDQTIEYTLQDVSSFSIDRDTGSITLIRGLDRETVESYTLTVLAVDTGTPPRTGTAAVQVIVQDINDNTPTLTLPTDVIRVEEIIQVNQILFTVTASDPDAGPNGEVVVSMDSDSEYFEFVPSSGALQVKQSLQRAAGTYTINFIATDKGTDPMESTGSVTIVVVPVNSHAPEFEQIEYRGLVMENNDRNKVVQQVTARDLNAGDSVEYHIEAIDEPVTAFAVDKTSGEIRAIVVLDRENQDEYTFRVVAVDDGAEPTGQRSGSCTVNIIVDDENDNYPTITLPPQPVRVSEDEGVTEFVTSVQAVDIDDDLNGEIGSYRLQESGRRSFEIERDTGDISIRLPLDREVQSSYTLLVTVEDKGDPAKTAERTLVVEITDINDNPPRFSESSMTVSVQKVTPVNSEVVKVVATDADEGVNAAIVYELDSGSTEFFALNPQTGSLRLIKDLKETDKSTFDFNVVATDGLYTDELELHLEVVEDNIHAPVFAQEEYEAEVLESAAPGSKIGVQVAATDRDSAQLAYSIQSGNDGNIFTIDSASGELSLLGELDFESEPEHELVVAASDGGVDGEDEMTATVTVVITVLNVNEYAPSFVDGPVYQVSVTENSEKDLLLLEATDADMDSVKYSLPDLDSDEPFSIDAETGMLRTSELDREMQDEYLVIVTAVDSGEPPRTSTAEVYVTVGDVNDNAPEFDQSDYTVTVLLDSLPDDGSFFTVTAKDVDDVGSPPTYTIIQGNDGQFAIDPDTGTLSVNVGTNGGEYNLVIQATDGGGRSATVRISVNAIGETVTGKPTSSQAPINTTIETPISTTKKTSGAGHRLVSMFVVGVMTLVSILWSACN